MLSDERASYSTLPQPPKRGDAKYVALRGQVITISEAAEEFDVPRQSIATWVRNAYIEIVTAGHRGIGGSAKLDKSDTAFCSDVYHWRKKIGFGPGAPLLDENGEAYQLRWLDVARYRRKRKELPNQVKATSGD